MLLLHSCPQFHTFYSDVSCRLQENDGHSQFSQGLAAHGGRSALYDDDDESDGMNDDDDVRMDEDEEEDSSPRPGSHIKALLDNDDGAGEDAEASTSPREMKGARWRGWELKLLIRNMHDLSVLDPNLTAKERMEVWQQIAELQTQAHAKRNSMTGRTSGACSNAWARVFKRNNEDKKLSDIATGTDEEDGEVQRMLDDLVALAQDLKRGEGKKHKGKGKRVHPSEKRRDEATAALQAKEEGSKKRRAAEIGSDEDEDDMDADLQTTPKRKQTKSRVTPGIKMIEAQTSKLMEGYQDVIASQRDMMESRMKQGRIQHEAELRAASEARAAEERRFDADRISAERKHAAQMSIERERLQMEARTRQEDAARIQQLEHRMTVNQEETRARQDQLQAQLQQISASTAAMHDLLNQIARRS